MTTNGVNGVSAKPDSQWKVGLKNSAGKYLTAESFGFKINASGSSLKKKQTFILEQDPSEDVIYIRSHTNRFLSADKYGNVTCEADERGPSEKFVVEYAKDGSGRWAFRNGAHGNYLGGTEDNFKCFAKNVTETELWIVQLSIHPQVNLKNVNRKRYARMNDEQLQASELIPWGKEALVILHFDGGKYSLKTFDNRFLHRDGSLTDEIGDDTKFTLEIRAGTNGGLAFKDCTGAYLTAVGASATMKGRNKTISKDELFVIEDSHPQVVLFSASNKKKVSIKQGVDVSANQADDEESEKEIFQMELVDDGKWAFRTVDNMYWKQDAMGGIQANSRQICPAAKFEVEWQGDGSLALKANNGSYVSSKQTGHLTAASSTVTDKERFIIRIINRPLLILKNEFGFVGLKAQNKTEVQCSKNNYEIIFLEASNEGHYYLKGANQKYWSVKDDASIAADSDQPVPFYIEPQGPSEITLKAPNGCFVKGEHNGLFRAIGQELDSSMIWEY